MDAITITSKETLEKALAEAEGKARERKITVEDIIRTAEVIKASGATYDELSGREINVNLHPTTVPGSYKGTPMSTQFTLKVSKRKWYVTDIRRDAAWKRPVHDVVTEREEECSSSKKDDMLVARLLSYIVYEEVICKR